MTKYRKVAVSERLPNDSGYYFGIDSLGHREYPYFDKEGNKWESIWDTTHWLEEIPDNTPQLQKDKEELLEALEKISKVTNEGYITDDTDFQVWESELKQVHSEIETLIQKHKQ